MASASSDNKLLCRHAAAALGGVPRVIAYWDDQRARSVAVLSCRDAPRRGLTSYSTVSLSDSALVLCGKEYPIRIEIVGACASDVPEFANVMATAAFFVVKDKWFCRPGVVFETLVGMYNLSAAMEHLYFTAPSQWPDLNRTMELTTKKVTWLWAVPISEAESRFIREHGEERFEDLLEASGVDVFDIHRSSTV